MSEYRAYKGYYIGPGTFQSKAEIDEHIKQQAIRTYKSFCHSFARCSSIEAALVMSEKADWMHKQLGMSYEEIEAIEIAAFNKM